MNKDYIRNVILFLEANAHDWSEEINELKKLIAYADDEVITNGDKKLKEMLQWTSRNSLSLNDLQGRGPPRRVTPWYSTSYEDKKKVKRAWQNGSFW